MFHTKFDHKMHYLWGNIFYVCPICDLQMSSNFSQAKKCPYNSAELYANLFYGILRNSLKELEWYFRTFPQNFRTFPQKNGKIVWKSAEKTTLCGNVRKYAQLYGNRRNCAEIRSGWDLVEIWFELASQLDLNCSENVKKPIVNSC